MKKTKHGNKIILSLACLGAGLSLVGLTTGTYASYSISQTLTRTVGKLGSVKTLFLDTTQNLGGGNSWNTLDPNGNVPAFWLHLWINGSQQNQTWVKCTNTVNGYRSFTYSSVAGYDRVIFYRVDPTMGSDLEPSGAYIYNQTDTLTLSNSNNLYRVTSWHTGGDDTPSGGTWAGIYNPTA